MRLFNHHYSDSSGSISGQFFGQRMSRLYRWTSNVSIVFFIARNKYFNSWQWFQPLSQLHSVVQHNPINWKLKIVFTVLLCYRCLELVSFFFQYLFGLPVSLFSVISFCLFQFLISNGFLLLSRFEKCCGCSYRGLLLKFSLCTWSSGVQQFVRIVSVWCIVSGRAFLSSNLWVPHFPTWDPISSRPFIPDLSGLEETMVWPCCDSACRTMRYCAFVCTLGTSKL